MTLLQIEPGYNEERSKPEPESTRESRPYPLGLKMHKTSIVCTSCGDRRKTHKKHTGMCSTCLIDTEVYNSTLSIFDTALSERCVV